MIDETQDGNEKLTVEAAKVQSEHDRAMVGHAVAHLNNLLPRFGVTHFAEGYQAGTSEDAMGTVPDQVKGAVARATIAAAHYLEAAFRRERLSLIEGDEEEAE